jgi:hypothetical protein
MHRFLFATAMLSVLAACAAPQSTGSNASAGASTSVGLGAELANMTLSDLQNASTDAKAHGDKLAATCYDFLATQITSEASTLGASVTGPVSAFQRARDLQNAITGGVSQDFQINCAPLLSDVQANLTKLGAVGAGALASGGLLP